MLIQLGEAETAVYFRTFERIGTFCEGDALYLVCTSFILEADADALFCQPLLQLPPVPRFADFIPHNRVNLVFRLVRLFQAVPLNLLLAFGEV